MAVKAGDEEVLADRLEALAREQKMDLVDIRDPFSGGGQPVGAGRGGDGTAAVFQQKHRLTAVMVKSSGGQAIVDNKPIAVGQELDGFTLVTLSKSTALFRSGRAEAMLRMEDGASLSDH